MISLRYIIPGLLALSATVLSCDSPSEPGEDQTTALSPEISIDTFHINIEEEDFQKIVERREASLSMKKLQRSNDDYVPADIVHNGVEYKVKLRLKGDLPDHWKGERWSYRVKTKNGKLLLGLRKFSIQDPDTRNGLWEWIFQKMLEEQGLMHLTYEFVYVIQNGERKGVYAFEEHFRDELLVRNNKKPGVILCYDESEYWKVFQKIPDNREAMYEVYAKHFQTAPIRPYNDAALEEDSALAAQFEHASKLLEKFRNDEIHGHQVFDVEKLGAYFAMTDLLGAFHATLWGNMRFFYDPETGLLEPIGFDADAGYLSDTLAQNNEKLLKLNGKFHEHLFSDPQFVTAYQKHLRVFAHKDFFPTFLRRHDKQLAEYENLLQINGKSYEIDPAPVYQNRTMIMQALPAQ